MKNKSGVTVIEIMVVVIIVGILAAMAVPVFTNWIERTRGDRAIANIEIIKDAERIYRVKYHHPVPAALYDLTEINTLLNLELTDNNFGYLLACDIPDPEDFVIVLPDWTPTYTVSATRTEGVHQGTVLNYDLLSEEWSLPESGAWPWHPE